MPVTLNEKRLLSFKDRHAGQRVFIIGNGPSLNQCDLSPLQNEITFGVNGIFLNREKMGFLPTYYVVEDEFVAEDRAAEINDLRGPQKFFGNYLNYCIEDRPDVIWLNLRMDYGPVSGLPPFQSQRSPHGMGGRYGDVCLPAARILHGILGRIPGRLRPFI